MNTLRILLPKEGEVASALLRRLKRMPGQVLLVIGDAKSVQLQQAEQVRAFAEGLKPYRDRIKVATRLKILAAALRAAEVTVVDTVGVLREVLGEHPQSEEALRVYSPHVWRQQLRSHLQSLGLLSLPRIRARLLLAASVGLFFFVILRLLPSAHIRIVIRQEDITQTANVLLVQSGAVVADLSQQVRMMPLQPIRVSLHQSLTFDAISKEFIGESARTTMTVINKSDETFRLKAKSRLVNHAGMVFLLNTSVTVPPSGEKEVAATAADIDIYGEILGERANLPAGVHWDFLGLNTDQRKLVYAENRVPSTRGTTHYRTVLKQQDLELAEKQLKSQLLSSAKQLVAEELILRNDRSPEQALRLLDYEILTKGSFTGFLLPTQFIGESVNSIPVEGGIVYTALGYDSKAAMDLLQEDLQSHVEQGKRLVEGSVTLERLQHVVIDYDDDLAWVKLTLDLSGLQEPVLDPLTPTGARFRARVLELILNKSLEDSTRILKNLPEVDSVNISLWPPWSRNMPGIPYHITLSMVDHDD